MSQVIQLAPSSDVHACVDDARDPIVRTDAVHVVFTSVVGTLAAVRVAAGIARAMGAPLKVVHFRAVPYVLAVDAPVGVSPIETDDFRDRLRAEGIQARVRVYLCRDERRAIPMAFKRRSIVVLAGGHRRWPTTAERLRQRLEAAGHYVLFVDVRDHQEDSRA